MVRKMLPTRGDPEPSRIATSPWETEGAVRHVLLAAVKIRATTVVPRAKEAMDFRYCKGSAPDNAEYNGLC
jgi:hypothetical protein